MSKSAEKSMQQVSESEQDLLERLWQTSAHDVLNATDRESFFQAQHSYFLSIFAITNTYDIASIDAEVLNDRYNEGLRQAAQLHKIDLFTTEGMDHDGWRQTFRTTLAGVHQPERVSLPETYSDLLRHLFDEPKRYFHQHLH